MKSKAKRTCLLVLAMFGGGVPASATPSAPELCEDAATFAAERHSIPAQILRTLTLAETGRTLNGTLRPWPWAINHAGEGHWFASQEEMLAHAETLVASGQRNFDIGCFQLNYRWHGEAFSSLAQMSEPETNAAYAAWFLRSKYTALGSWQSAVGAYHSQTEVLANAYLARFEAVFAQWVGGDAAPVTRAPAQAQSAVDDGAINGFPLLIAGRASQGPSLVPLMDGRLRLIGRGE